MKTFSLVLLAAALTAMTAERALATAVGTTTVYQPVNLGPRSVPGRIPLGRVGAISNYNYGIHRVIGEPRPCPDGAMRWAGGSELDQNLASVFGISVEPEDSSSVPGAPVILRVKPWSPPAYSPYTKEQVLAATLWALIRSSGGTPERPLNVRVLAEGVPDKALEKKYSAKFITGPGKDGKAVPPPTVPGTRIEVDGRGMSWVVFPDVKKKAPNPPSRPVMILFEMTGEVESGYGTWYLLPAWSGGTRAGVPYHLNTWPAAMSYSCLKTQGRHDANSFLLAGGVHYFDASHGETGDGVKFGMPGVPQATLAANILALVISAQPSAERPFKVVIAVSEHGLARLPAFRGAPDWKETRHDARTINLECEFVWDAANRKLLKGSVPLVTLHESIALITADPPAKSPDKDLSRLVAKDSLSRISRGIRDGSLLAEQNLDHTMLAKSGLQRELGKAGYYAGLATYCHEAGTPENELPAPAFSGPSVLEQYFRLGWNVGLNRGFKIAKEARRIREEQRRNTE